MGLVGARPYGVDPTYLLRRAFDDCCLAWGSDPAYKDARWKIESALREIELIEASPGARAARSRPAATMTGQDRSSY